MSRVLSCLPARLLAAVAGVLVSASLLPAAAAPDLKTVAERVVGESARVKAGDRVIVRGDVRDIALIEEISFAVMRRGAEPLQVLGREQAQRRYFDAVPAAMDATPPGLSLKLLDAANVEIFVTGQEFPAQLSDVPPERIATTTKRMVEVGEARLKRPIRYVEVGNGLYPTDATARRYGLAKAQLADMYWAGLNVDHQKLQATGDAVRAVLRRGKVVRVTHPNGTDLEFRIEGRNVGVSAGIISDEAAAKGGPGAQVWLPAGEVYTTPCRSTAARSRGSRSCSAAANWCRTTRSRARSTSAGRRFTPPRPRARRSSRSSTSGSIPT